MSSTRAVCSNPLGTVTRVMNKMNEIELIIITHHFYLSACNFVFPRSKFQIIKDKHAGICCLLVFPLSQPSIYIYIFS